LKVLADLGVFFLMFYAGIQTNPFDLKRMGGKSSLVGASGFLVPFAAGYLLCRYGFGMANIESLFMALALSITAIAVNARLLDDLGLHRCRIAPVIIGASLVDDVLSLAFFSAIVALAQGNSGGLEAMFTTLVKVFFFFGLSTIIGMQIYPKLTAYFSSREAKGFTFSLIVALFFGILAEFSGLHIIIGAYMAGLFVREGIVNRELLQKIEDRFVSITYGFLGPVFFVSLSFHMRFDIFTENLWFVVALLIVATLSKVAGSFAGARLGGMNKTESKVVAFAMNGRGAVELIIASIGLELGIINDTLFSALVVVAFVTTMFPSISISMLLKRKGRLDLRPLQEEAAPL